jgi:hypothetical protein
MVFLNAFMMVATHQPFKKQFIQNFNSSDLTDHYPLGFFLIRCWSHPKRDDLGTLLAMLPKHLREIFQHLLRAVEGNWTLDLFLTKEVLYPWATTAAHFFKVAEGNWTLHLGAPRAMLYPWATTAFNKVVGYKQYRKTKTIPNNQQPNERETRLEPATYSLEGYRSTNWATPAYILFPSLLWREGFFCWLN